MSDTTAYLRPGEPERESLLWLRWMLQRWWEYGAAALNAADVHRALQIAEDAIEADATCPKGVPGLSYPPPDPDHVYDDGSTFPTPNPFRESPCGVQIVDGVARPVPWAGDPIPPNHEVVHRDELSRLRCQPDLEWHRRMARMDVPALVGITFCAALVLGYVICWLKGVS